MFLGVTGRRVARKSRCGIGKGEMLGLKTVEERWGACLDSLPEDFFGNQEAALRVKVEGGRGSPLCAALRVDEENNKGCESNLPDVLEG